MGVWEQSPARGHPNLDGGGSATAFSAVSGSRWVLQGGAIGWQNMAAIATISLIELDTTNSGVIFTFVASLSNGIANFFLGEHGMQASSSYSSRLVMNAGAVAGTITGMFTGYYTGK
jgi:hypothetical protein